MKSDAAAEKKNKKPAQKPIMRPRHRFIFRLGRLLLTGHVKKKYHIDIVRSPELDDRQCLILYNHQTGYDQFFVPMSIHQPIYNLATEDLFSNGLVSKLLVYFFAPIPIKKQVTDLKAMREIFRLVKEGGSLAIAPEGNRTYSGRTAYIKPSIASLAKKLGLPIVLYRIEGGYGVQPRWSDVIRDGRMKGYVARVLEPEEYKSMSADELAEIILSVLDVNEAVDCGEFPSDHSAEYLERAVYVCPDCGLSTFRSEGQVISCTKCGKKIRYGSNKQLTCEKGAIPFKNVYEWYCFQNDYVNSLDPTQMTDSPLYEETADIQQVFLYKNRKPFAKQAKVLLYGDRIVLKTAEHGEIDCHYEDVSAVTVLGKNKLNIYHKTEVYQLRGDSRFNALKYVNLHERYENIVSGHPEETFLGM